MRNQKGGMPLTPDEITKLTGIIQNFGNNFLSESSEICLNIKKLIGIKLGHGPFLDGLKFEYIMKIIDEEHNKVLISFLKKMEELDNHNKILISDIGEIPDKNKDLGIRVLCANILINRSEYFHILRCIKNLFIKPIRNCIKQFQAVILDINFPDFTKLLNHRIQTEKILESNIVSEIKSMIGQIDDHETSTQIITLAQSCIGMINTTFEEGDNIYKNVLKLMRIQFGLGTDLTFNTALVNVNNVSIQDIINKILENNKKYNELTNQFAALTKDTNTAGQIIAICTDIAHVYKKNLDLLQNLYEQITSGQPVNEEKKDVDITSFSDMLEYIGNISGDVRKYRVEYATLNETIKSKLNEIQDTQIGNIELPLQRQRSAVHLNRQAS